MAKTESKILHSGRNWQKLVRANFHIFSSNMKIDSIRGAYYVSDTIVRCSERVNAREISCH